MNLLWPPISFLLILVIGWGLMRTLGGLSAPASQSTGGKRKAYACGEEMKENRVQPNYSQFFPFAFFFTIMHVLALVVATVPVNNWPAVQIAAGYLICLSIGLFILFRR